MDNDNITDFFVEYKTYMSSIIMTNGFIIIPMGRWQDASNRICHSEMNYPLVVVDLNVNVFLFFFVILLLLSLLPTYAYLYCVFFD